MLTIQQKIRMALAYRDMSEAELARLFGTTPAAFSQRLKTGKFTGEEMEQIAKILGGRWRAEFVFEDGLVI